VHGQDQHLDAAVFAGDAFGDFQPVQFLHADVEQDEVGRVGLDDFQRLTAVAGFGDDFHVGIFWINSRRPARTSA
jgi:hypothetical protein